MTIENCRFSSDAKEPIVGNNIGLGPSLPNSRQKNYVQDEEIAQAELTATDITDMSGW